MKLEKRQVDGILLLDKPSGISSNQALQKVKRLYAAKKAGHTGNLDLLATGMLPICLGEATKFAQYLLAADKSYRVVAKLGERSATCDSEGEIIEKKSIDHITPELLNQVLAQFKGEIQQIPSMYSALKKQGQPLYKLARKGITVERKLRNVTIYALNLLRWQRNLLVLDVHCSKGTYIRNLVDDIGQALGSGAYVLSLRRNTVGLFQAKQMIPLCVLSRLAEKDGYAALDQLLLPVEVMGQHLPSLLLTDEQARLLRMGRIITLAEDVFGLVRCLDGSGKFIGIGEVLSDGKLVSRRLLHFSGK